MDKGLLFYLGPLEKTNLDANRRTVTTSELETTECRQVSSGHWLACMLLRAFYLLPKWFPLLRRLHVTGLISISGTETGAMPFFFFCGSGFLLFFFHST
jgi:hypothetical protein